jgi:hypothetical protein
MTDQPPESSVPSRGFAQRFGPTLLQGGITPIPSTLYRYQGTLGLTAQEVWFIGYILMYKWDAALPYPSLIRMAEDTGMSRRNLQRIKDSLVAKGALVLIPRHTAEGRQDSNAYDFRPLFARLEYCIQEWGPKAEYRPRSVADDGETRSEPSCPSVTAPSHSLMTFTSHPHVTSAALDETSTSYPSVSSAAQWSVSSASQTTVPVPSHEEEPVRKETKEKEPPPPEGGGGGDDPFSLSTDSGASDTQYQETRSVGASLPATPYSGPTNGKHRELAERGIHLTPKGTPQRESPARTEEPSGSDRTQRVEQLRTALANWRAAPGAAQRTDLPDTRLNRLWQLTQLQLQMSTPPETDLRPLRYGELRELDTLRGWALLTVPNAQFQAQLQQAPLNHYVHETLSWLCRRAINVAVVVPTHDELPTLDRLLTQEAALPTATANAAAPQSRGVPIEVGDNRAAHAPVPLLLASTVQADAPP